MKRVVNRILCSCALAFSFNIFATEINVPTLATNGYAEITAKPDKAVFTVAIQSERSQVNQAKQAVDKVVVKLTSALTNKGVERKDMSSSNLQLSPKYSYPKEAKPVLDGYQAVRYITVNVEQLDKLNELLDAALASGVNRVDNIELKVKDETAYKLKAREAAIADAKQKAQALATAFDTSLDGVWSINYRSHTARPVVMAKSMMMESRSVDQSYQDQAMIISDQVDVVFKLKNNE